MRILFAEDDRDLSKAVSTLLERASYSVDAVYNGADALDYALGAEYDAIILDVMMPKVDGVEVMKRLRRQGVATPSLMLTAKDAVLDRVTGLDAGADDYLTKPFAASELLARVRALLRRRGEFTPDFVRFQDLALDRSCMLLSCGEKTVRLGNKAFQMMEMLMDAPRKIHPRHAVYGAVWGWDSEAEINVVWVNISFLRKKIQELGAHVEIKASRGAGYSLEAVA
jgi:DNA-binding response OmpR family regulator